MVVDALAQVARWYRRQRHAAGPTSIDDSSATLACCPATRINRMLSTASVRRFLEDNIETLSQSLQRDQSDHELHASLALFLELLDSTDPRVLHHMAQAMKLDPAEGSYKAHHVRMKFNATAIEQRSQLEASLANPLEPSSPSYLPVPIERPSSLSKNTFMTNYALQGRPVLIQGGASLVVDPLWTLDTLAADSTVANTMVDTKRKVADSVRWARLEEGPRVSLSDFISRMRDPSRPASAEPLYVHDVSIPLHFPDLAQRLSLPAYFAGDLLQLTPEGTLYRETWPSLFVGPEGSESQTHVDAFGSNFWMALLQGRKRWLLVHPDDMHLLYPVWHAGSSDVVFGVDLAVPDISWDHALFGHARVWECTLEAGDVLFVPAGAPHFVQNLTHTVAVSSNYIDASNWVRASTALAHQAHTEPRAADLLSHLQRVVEQQHPPPRTSENIVPPPPVSFHEFKHPPAPTDGGQSTLPSSPARKRPRSAYADLVADFASPDDDLSD